MVDVFTHGEAQIIRHIARLTATEKEERLKSLSFIIAEREREREGGVPDTRRNAGGSSPSASQNHLSVSFSRELSERFPL